MSVVAPNRAAPAQQTRIELADVFARYADEYFSTHQATSTQLKVARAIVRCRTAALGGHREWCKRCGHKRHLYHSCRNRHCPKCQTLAKASWVENRQRELLPTPYFHNVFTLPHELNPLILASQRNRRALLDLLFRAATDTLLAFGRNNLGGKVGFTMVLHTWDQQLRAHFHLHCVIAGGAIREDGTKWINAGKNFLFPRKSSSAVSCCTFCRRDSCESVTTASSPIAPRRPAWLNAESSCRRRHQNRPNQKPLLIGCLILPASTSAAVPTAVPRCTVTNFHLGGHH